MQRNRSHTQTHNKNNTTHDTTRTTPQHHNALHDKNNTTNDHRNNTPLALYQRSWSGDGAYHLPHLQGMNGSQVRGRGHTYIRMSARVGCVAL